ncbi:MAG: hypothetical protein HFK09_04710 [Clostridia bacterium]|nr:hypothetical protein [Clostridia bacterium]
MRGNRYLKVARRAKARRLVNRFASGLDAVKDEAAVPFTSAAKYTNFRVSKGVLTDGWGIERHVGYAEKENVAAVWEYSAFSGGVRKSIPMYCDDGGVVHISENGEDRAVEGAVFTSAPVAIDYRLYGEDVCLICSPTDGMAVFDGESLRKIEPSPRITSMTLHYERLFVTSANESDCVRFSDDLDPTNWAEGLESGGFIRLADGYGRCNRVLSFLNYVYIFRDYGISRMIAYADQTEFSVSNLYVSSGRIYADTVAVCGDKVIFLASDGLYAFDGLETVRLKPSLGTLTDFKNGAKATYFEGKYFLAYGVSGEENDSLLVYDLATREAELSSGFKIDAFACGVDLAAISDGRVVRITPCGSAFGAATKKIWRVPFGSLSSPDSSKKVEKISLETATDLTLTVYYDGKSREVHVRKKEGVQDVKVGVRGKKIGLQIECTAVGTRVADISIVTSAVF